MFKKFGKRLDIRAVFLTSILAISIYNLRCSPALRTTESLEPCSSSPSSPPHGWIKFRDLASKSVRNEHFQGRSLEYCNQPGWVAWERQNCQMNTGATMQRVPHLHELMDSIRELIIEKNVPGDFVECGVWQGGTSVIMGLTRDYFGEESQRKLWLFDSFSGHPVYTDEKDSDMTTGGHKAHESKYLAVSLETVQSNMNAFQVTQNVEYVKGYFNDTMPERKDDVDKIAVLRMDADSYTSTMTILVNLYDKVPVGGIIIVDDYYDYQSCKEAVEEFRHKRGITSPILHANDRTKRPYWVK